MKGVGRGRRLRRRVVHSLWDGGWSVGALLGVAAPVVGVLLLAPEVRQAADVAAASGIVAYVVVLFADLLIYLHWRMSGGGADWLVLALTAVSVQSLALAGLVAADPGVSQTHPTRILLVQAAMTVGLFGVVARAHRHSLRIDPLLAGTVLGAAIIAVRFLVVEGTEPLYLSSAGLHVLVGAVLAIDLAVALALFQLTSTTPWVRARLAGAMALLSISHAASYPVPDGTLLSGIAVVTSILGATLLLTLAIALLRRSWQDNRSAMDLLRQQLEQAEAGARIEQARLHELRSTVAGLGTASRLVHQSSVSGARRQRIESMIDSEIERLQRLLSETHPGLPAPIDLDSTIEPIVLRHQTRGYPIRWSPSGHWAIGRSDDVAEVVNVLLENAFQHAPGAEASIETRRSGEVVEIAISDTGPGIARALRPRIFEWGERGRSSGGSGIGLNVAHQLSSELGGYLRLAATPVPGTTFVLGLRAKDSS